MRYFTGITTAGLLFSIAVSLPAQGVGIETMNPDSTLSIQNKLEIGGAQGDVVFTDDQGSITFPGTALPNTAMINMFALGSTNADRMVLAHSPSFQDWGLQYRDGLDQFHFLGNGISAFAVDLQHGRIAVGDAPLSATFTINASTAQEDRTAYMINNKNTANDTYGIYAGAFGTGSGDKRGGSFDAFAGTGTNIGVRATATAATTNVAVYGLASGGVTNWAAHFDQGDVIVDDNVGIGTQNPGTKLHITSGSEASLLTNGYVQIGSTPSLNLVFDNNEITARNNGLEAALFLNPNQGNVSIGTTSDLGANLNIDGNAGQNTVRFRTNGSTKFVIDQDGAVLINSLSNKKAGYELNVDGQIVAEEVLVQNSSAWPDFVFTEDYDLLPLSQVEQHILSHKHLPGVPSAADIEKDGILLGEMDRTLMQKVEELTLYMIQQAKEIEQLKQENVKLRKLVEYGSR